MRYKLNDWVDEYAKGNEDVVKIDLLGPLAASNGGLKEEYSIDLEDSDSHPHTSAHLVCLLRFSVHFLTSYQYYDNEKSHSYSGVKDEYLQ